MKTIGVRTEKKDQIINITSRVQQYIQEEQAKEGICVVFAAHTTCSITTADLDPGTDQDFIDALRHIQPDIRYRHPHNPKHAPDHILSSIIGPSVMVPFSNGELKLGTWQEIVLVELDGPRDRTVHLSLLR